MHCTFGCLWMGKLDAKNIKYFVIGYWEGIKMYRFVYMHTKQLIKSKDVIFMEDSINVANDFGMCPSGRNEVLMVVVVYEYSKSHLFDNGEETEEKIKDNYVGNQERKEGPTRNDVDVERLGEKRRYPTRERHPLGGW